MDFFKIVMDGFLSKSKYDNLEKYFLRTYREASDKHYSYDEYFDELVGVLDGMANAINDRRMKLISDCHRGIVSVKDDITKSEDEKQKYIDDFKSQIDTFNSVDAVPLQLHIYTRGGYQGNLYDSRIRYALEHLKWARYTVELEEKELKLDEHIKKQKDLEIELSKIDNDVKAEDTSDNDIVYPEHIFTKEGYLVFSYMKEKMFPDSSKRGYKKDVLYCYHKLRENKKILVKIMEFINWYFEEFKIDLGESETLDQTKTKNDTRESHYSLILEQYIQKVKERTAKSSISNC